jgi:hypothetical protein
MLAQLDADSDGTITSAEVDAVEDSGVAVDGLVYTKEEITGQFEATQKGFNVKNGVTPSQWLDVKLDRDLLAQLNTSDDHKISPEEIEAVRDAEVYVGGAIYSKDDLAVTFRKVQEELGLKEDEALDRDQWLTAKANDWKPIWAWPSVCLFVILGFFALAFRDKPVVEEPAPGGEEAGE